MNKTIIDNYAKLKLSALSLPLVVILSIATFLFSKNTLTIDSYIKIQEKWFFFLNAKLSQFPSLQYNLTQFGDALVFLSILSIFVIYAPKLWEALISASLVSLLFCPILKKFFSIPRPAAFYDNDNFTIIGKTLSGHNSLPSGHSITVFTILTVIAFAFIPKDFKAKILWYISFIIIGLVLAFTRVGVGAHYPIDVLIGCSIGYISAILGIFICRKYKMWNWISNRKFYPIFILLFLACGFSLIQKIMKEDLIIFYFALICLVISLFTITFKYVKK
ncbi:MAG: phosphatase PAP2 family protein [Cruoricaptor ignavus]|nr:phosphatase PAP2 family protein [Cruoricaptor ignavus]